MPLSRHLCREIALQALFACESRSIPLPSGAETTLAEVLTAFHADAEEPAGFAWTLVHGVANHQSQLREAITRHAPQWPFDKINVLDRCILYLGAYEMLCERETPPAVIINECVELAKKYGADSSARFINGALNALQAERSL